MRFASSKTMRMGAGDFAYNTRAALELNRDANVRYNCGSARAVFQLHAADHKGGYEVIALEAT